MGRNKIEIKKIPSPSFRRITYLKRREGFLKKAYELATLCDLDLLVIMFSESGELTTHCLPETTVEKVLRRVLKTPDRDWKTERIQDLKFLKRIVDQLDAERQRDAERVAFMQREIENLKSRLQKIQSLDYLIDVRVEQSDSIEALDHLTNSLTNGLSQVREWKCLRENTPNHIEPFLPASGTNGAEALAPIQMPDNQFPMMDDWTMDECYWPNLDHIHQLQAQSDVGQHMQHERECVMDVGQTSGATVSQYPHMTRLGQHMNLHQMHQSELQSNVEQHMQRKGKGVIDVEQTSGATVNQYPHMTPFEQQMNLHQIHQLEVQSNVAQRMQRTGKGVIDVGQTSGATVNQYSHMPPAMDSCIDLPKLHQIQQLQAQSNVGQHMQYEGVGVPDFWQPSGATVGESSASTSNLQPSEMFVPNRQCDNADSHMYGKFWEGRL